LLSLLSNPNDLDRLNDRLALDFRDRVNNELIFFCDGEYRYWVGQRLKRKDGSYLLNNSGCFKYGEARGRYQIDKETRIYSASQAVADEAKIRFAKMPISDKIAGLKEIGDACDKQIHYVETTATMIVNPHVTVSDKHKARATMFPEKMGGGSRGAERMLAEKQLVIDQRVAKTKKEENLSVDAGRRRLPELTKKFYDETIEYANNNKQLLVVASFGGWSKESTDMRKAMEDVNATLWKVYEGKNSDPKKEPPIMKGKPEDGGQKLPFLMVRWDPTKSNLLRERYKVNSVPIFIFYYNKQLVGIERRWNGYGQTKNDLIKELRSKQVDGERGRFLPKNFAPAPPGLMK